MFSRDAGYQYRPPRKTEFGDYGQMIQQGEEDAPAAPGVGGWDDFNAVSSAARETIREAAGIEIPDASFVVWVLAAYLVILVPFNWMVFRLIGRDPLHRRFERDADSYWVTCQPIKDVKRYYRQF